VHGGGFYHPVKFALSPPKLPEHLHWFYWESYSTWLTGFSLFTVSYLWSAGSYLIDKSVMDWSPLAAVAAALGFLVLFWLAYDGICRFFAQRKNGDAIVGALVALLVLLAAWLACHWFAGRAAYLLMGAMIATSMSANVFFWIIPGQRAMVASIQAGQAVDPIHGKRGKQRSVHNTYFTLPVLFAMLSNHYSFTYSHPQNWLVLVLMMFAGAAIRQFFVMRHGFKLGRNPHPWPYAAAGVLVIAAVLVWLKPAEVATGATASASSPALANVSTAAVAGVGGPIGYKTLQPILAQRCYMCHGPEVQMKNVRLDSAAGLASHAQMVYQQAVVTRIMPMNNATGISDAERAVIKQWFETGAHVD